MDAKEAAALAELKAEIARVDREAPDMSWFKDVSDKDCLRFLNGHNLNVSKAFTLMVNCSKWRHEHEIETIIHRYENSTANDIRFAKAYFPMGLLGKDSEGRSVVLNQMGTWDFPRIVKDYGLEKAIMFGVYGTEIALKGNILSENVVIINLSQEGHPRPPITGILEISPWINSLLQYVKALGAVMDPYFPETTYKVIFVNAPTMFWASWSIAKQFVAERTREKVEVYSSADSSSKRLLELLPPDSVPISLGGTNSLKGIGRGGKLPKGACTDPSFIAKLEEEMVTLDH